MKNIILGAAVSAAMVSGSVNATLPNDGNGLPILDGTVAKVYMSGASAARKFIEELLVSSSVPLTEALCDSTKAIYKYKDNINGKKQNAYLCDINTSHSDLGSLVSAAHVMLYKRSEGGSALGVNPLIDNDKIEYLKTDNSNCTLLTAPVPGVSLGEIECTYSLTDPAFHFSTESDLGVSDVDPGQFHAENTPTGFLPVTPEIAAANLSNIKPIAALTFGIPVTTGLRDALQEAQIASGEISDPGCSVGDETESCMPSLTKHQIASIYTAKIPDWNGIKVDSIGTGLFDFATTKPGSSRVHICRRVPGSGTQAQFGIKFLNRTCAGAGTRPATGNTGTPEFFPVTQVHEMSSSGDVTDCLNELNNGTNAANDFDNTYGVRWAVGIQSLEKNAGLGDDFRFVKVDETAPTLENVANGKYLDWVELTFQTPSVTLTGDLAALVDAMYTSAGSPAVLAALNGSFVHDFGASGYMAPPTATRPALPHGVLDLTSPINPYSHATPTSAVDNCRVPAVFGSELQLD